MLMKLLATIRKYWRYPCSPRPIRYLLVLTLAGLPGLVGATPLVSSSTPGVGAAYVLDLEADGLKPMTLIVVYGNAPVAEQTLVRTLENAREFQPPLPVESQGEPDAGVSVAGLPGLALASLPPGAPETVTVALEPGDGAPLRLPQATGTSGDPRAPATIPEPATLLLVGVGIVGLLGMGLRKRRMKP